MEHIQGRRVKADMVSVGSSKRFKCFMNLIEGARNVKTAFPFSAFQRKQHFATTIQITEPLAILLIPEMLPGVLMYFFKPLGTTRITR